MINNFSNTEKSLKRYLKEKVTITTATVVSFLIAGTVAVAADAVTNATQGTFANWKNDEANKDKTYYEFSVNQDGKGTLTEGKVAKEDSQTTMGNSLDFKNEAVKKLVTISADGKTITLNKDVFLNLTGDGADVQGTKTPIALIAEDGQKVINAGNIWVTEDSDTVEKVAMYAQDGKEYKTGTDSNDKTVAFAATENGKAAKATIENAGNIRVEAKNGSAMQIGVGGTAINSGTIVVDNENANGMLAYSQAFVDSKDKTKVLEGNERSLKNTGDIIVNNGRGMAVAAAGKYVTASNDGDIVVKAGKGVEIYESTTFGTILADQEGAGATTFTNNGTITVEEGTGLTATVTSNREAEFVNAKGANITVANADGAIGVEVKGNVTLTNNGTISATGNGQAVVVEADGKFVNAGTIRTTDVPATTPEARAEEVPAVAAVTMKGGEFVNAKGAVYDVAGTAISVEGNGVIVTNEEGATINVGAGEAAVVVANNTEEFTFVNEKGGIVKVAGEVTGDDAVVGGVLISGGTKAITFTNKGTAEFGKGAKITDSTVTGSTAENYGILKVEGAKKGTDDTATINNIFKALGIESGNVANNGSITNEKGTTLVSAGDDIYGKEIADIGNYDATGNNKKVLQVTGTYNGNGTTEIQGGKIEDFTFNVNNKLQFTTGTVKILDSVINIAGAKLVNPDANATDDKGDDFEFANGQLVINKEVNLEGTRINIATGYDKDADGNDTLSGAAKNAIVVGATGELNLTKATVVSDTTKYEKDGENFYALDLSGAADGTDNVTFADTTFVGNIKGGSQKGFKVTTGESSFQGTMEDVATINISGTNDKNIGSLKLSSDSQFIKSSTDTAITVGTNGKLVVEVGAERDEDGVYTANALNNGTDNSVKVTNDDGVVEFTTENFAGENVTVAVGSLASTQGITLGNIGTDSEVYIYDADDTDYTDGLDFKYNNELLSKIDGVLNNMNNQAVNVSNYFSTNKLTRAEQLDSLYTSNIYSETVRASYDMFKMNEDAVLSLNVAPKAGEVVTAGKVLYSNSEYDRDGRLGSRTSENETTGLMANVAYGLSDNSTLGFVFSGAKQDIDTDGGSADGDAFYFGVYNDTTVGKAQVRTGAAYQLNKFDADNTAASKSSDASYNSNAFGVYSQATFRNDLGNGLSLQPKLRAGLTHVDQEAVRDSYFGVDDAEITVFDLTAGADLVKEFRLEKATASLKLGAAYTYAMGDTDKEFTGSFRGGKESFDVLGAEIAENTVTLNLGAEVNHDNGFFYNGGFTYEFGSDDNSAYGVGLGAGYKF